MPPGFKNAVPSPQIEAEFPSSDTLAASASEVAFATAAAIAAIELKDARRFRGHIEGLITSSGTAVTVTLRIKLGGTTLITYTALAISNSQTDVPFAIDFEFTLPDVTADGDATDVKAWANLITNAMTAKLAMSGVTTTAVDLDLEAGESVTVTVQSSAATAGNSVSLKALTVDVVR